RPAHHSENAKREHYRCWYQGGRWERKDFRRDNSYCSHECQPDEWLAWRTDQFHPSAFCSPSAGKASPQSRAAISRARENVQRPTWNSERSSVLMATSRGRRIIFTLE